MPNMTQPKRTDYQQPSATLSNMCWHAVGDRDLVRIDVSRYESEESSGARLCMLDF
jgi:hypothetical protein